MSHHAYYLIGSDLVRAAITEELTKNHKIKTHGNPDFSELKYTTFTIDDARALKASAETMPTAANAKKIFVIQLDNITSEAQNALLKLLEEPAEYVHFFFIVAAAHLLLPTVKSRMSFIGGDNGDQKNSADNTDAKDFIKMPIAKRLLFIKDLVDDISDEKRPKQDAIDLLNAVQLQIYSDGSAKTDIKKLEVIEKARSYMNDRAPSIKMLLEFVALNN